MMNWELTNARWSSQALLDLLANGWKPFAVTESDDGATVWLRRWRLTPAPVKVKT